MSIHLFFIYIYIWEQLDFIYISFHFSQFPNISPKLTVNDFGRRGKQENRIALALEKRVRWREKVASLKDSVRNIKESLKGITKEGDMTSSSSSNRKDKLEG